MGCTLKQMLQDIFLWRDFTTEGERVLTFKEYGKTEDGKRYLKMRSRVIQETGEVLEKAFYSPDSRTPHTMWIGRVYMLN